MAVVGFSVASVAAFEDFDTGMREVFSLLPGVTEEAMDMMSDDVQRFMNVTGNLTEEAIPALYQALSAGVPQENVFDFLYIANKAAVAGVTELETAVDGLTTIINAYGLEISDATRVSDALFTAVRLGKTTFAELSDSMFQLAPIAAAFSVEFEQALAAVTAITTQGVPTSVAMTQVRQALVELGDAGSEVGQIFQELAGQTFQEFLESGHSLDEAFALLEQGAQAAGIPISQMFGSVEAGQAALALTGANLDTFTNVINEMGNAAGATDEAFALMNAGIGAALGRLGARWQSLMISMGRLLEPFITPIVEAFSILIAYIEGVVASGDVMNDWLMNLPSFLRPIVLAIGEFVLWLINAAASFSEMVAAIGAGVDPLIAFQHFLYEVAGAGAAEAFEDLVYWTREFLRVAQEVLQPVIDWIAANVEIQDVLIALGIAIASVVIPAILGFFAAFAPLVLLIATVSLFRTAWEENWGGIQEKTAAVVDWITNTGWPALLGFFQQIADAWNNVVWPGISAMWTWFMETGLPAIIGYIETEIIPRWELFVSIMGAIWDTVSGAFTSFYDWFMVNLNEALTWLDGTALPWVQAFFNFLGSVWDIVSFGFGRFYDWFMVNGLAPIMDWIDTEVTPRWQTFLDIMAGIWEAVEPAFIALYNGVMEYLQPLIDSIANIIQGLTDVKNMVGDSGAGYQAAADIGGNILGGLQSGQYSIGDVANAFGNALFGGNQFGGHVSAGVPTWVGETGREIFVPSSDGEIVNNRDSEMAAQGGGKGINININVYGEISDEQANRSVYKLKRELQAQGLS